MTVSEVSTLAAVTVRALHHYDEIGLLSPSERSEAGYRLYSRDDLDRLQEILVWRQLGFALAEIRALLDDPVHDRVAALRRQRTLIEDRRDRLSATARALDAALDAHEQGNQPEVKAMFEGFAAADHVQEARERWGDGDAYRESAARTAGYGEPQWREIRDEFDAIVAAFEALAAAGEPAGGEPARAVAQRHREHIARWFYDCPPALHRGLGELYASDARFARNFDRRRAGLAVFVRDAIAANAE